MAVKDQAPQTPTSSADLNPPDMAGDGQTRLVLASIMADLRDIKAEIRSLQDHRFSDMMWHIGALVATAVVLGGMMIAAYFKLDDRIQALSNSSTNSIQALSNSTTNSIQALSNSTKDRFEAASNERVRIETKLDDLLQRIPSGQGQKR